MPKKKHGPKKGTGGRPRKYATAEEARAAKKAYQREYARRNYVPKNSGRTGRIKGSKNLTSQPETDLELQIEGSFTIHLPLRAVHRILGDAGWELYRKPLHLKRQ